MRWKDRTFQLVDRDALMGIAHYDLAHKRPRPFI